MDQFGSKIPSINFAFLFPVYKTETTRTADSNWRKHKWLWPVRSSRHIKQIGQAVDSIRPDRISQCNEWKWSTLGVWGGAIVNCNSISVTRYVAKVLLNGRSRPWIAIGKPQIHMYRLQVAGDRAMRLEPYRSYASNDCCSLSSNWLPINRAVCVATVRHLLHGNQMQTILLELDLVMGVSVN